MQISIRRISYEGRELIWEYDEKTDTATCLGNYLAGYTIEKCNETILNQILSDSKTFPFVQLIAGKATILSLHDYISEEEIRRPFNRDLSSSLRLFGSSHSYTIISAKSSVIKSEHRSPKTEIEEKEEEIPTVVEKEQTSQELSINLDALIPNDEAHTTLWRETLAYEEELLEQIKTQLTQLKQLKIISLRMLLKVQTKALLLTKQSMLLQLRELFDNILAPLYEALPQSRSEEVARETHALLVTYLQNAIKGIMSNSEHNGPTKYETMPKSERLKLFKGNEEAYQAAVNQGRKAQAEAMLLPLNFVLPPAESNLAKFNLLPQLRDRLEELQFAAQKHQADIKCIMMDLIDLLIKLGKDKYQFTLPEHQFISEREAISDYYSCHHSLTVLLKLQMPSKAEAELQDLSTEVMTAVVKTIYKAKIQEHIPDLIDGDAELYLRASTLNNLKEHWDRKFKEGLLKKSSKCQRSILAESIIELIRKEYGLVELEITDEPRSPRETKEQHTLREPKEQHTPREPKEQRTPRELLRALKKLGSRRGDLATKDSSSKSASTTPRTPRGNESSSIPTPAEASKTEETSPRIFKCF